MFAAALAMYIIEREIIMLAMTIFVV